jgi:two-component sensor histidine kinase
MMFTDKIKRLHYKKLFLYGAYSTIILLAIPASFIDYLIGSNVDVVVDVAFAFLTYLAYRFGFQQENTERAAALLFWIATLFEFVYLAVHDIDFDLIFSVLIPLIAFISMSRRRIVWHLTLYYLLLIGYLWYGYSMYSDHPYLHNSRFLLALGVSHGFIVSFGIFYAMAIEESVDRLEASNRAKTLLLSEVHHRVKNNLNLIASILGLQGQRHLHPEAADALEDNRRRIESMAILHEILYQNDHVGHVDLKTYLETLTDHIVRTEAAARVEMTRTIAPLRLPMDRMIQIGIMLNEMVTNSIKHAADDQGDVTLSIVFSHTEEGDMLRYCDQAQVIDEGALTRGFGHTLILLAAEQLRGRVEIETDKGLCYIITFEKMEEEG